MKTGIKSVKDAELTYYMTTFLTAFHLKSMSRTNRKIVLLHQHPLLLYSRMYIQVQG